MKKILALLLVVILTATVSISGTLAFVQASAAPVDVMEAGNVKIDQQIFRRKVESSENTMTSNLERCDAHDDKDALVVPLYPAVYDELSWNPTWLTFETGGSSAMFADEVKNVQDRIVFVKNSGSSDVYVRTWFAFECGSLSAAEFDEIIGLNINNTHWTWDTIGIRTLTDEKGSNNYLIMLATYNGNTALDENSTGHQGGCLPAGSTTRPSLLQILLYNTVGNEECQAIDGNNSGTLEIRILSQAAEAVNGQTPQSILDGKFGHTPPSAWNPTNP